MEKATKVSQSTCKKYGLICWNKLNFVKSAAWKYSILTHMLKWNHWFFTIYWSTMLSTSENTSGSISIVLGRFLTVIILNYE